MLDRRLVTFLFCLAAVGCEEADDTLLVVELVPNPEVNTREQVEGALNRVDLVLDAEGGFAGLDAEEGDDWGRYHVTDYDDDGDLELVFQRRASEAMARFGVAPGHQRDKIITVGAWGFDQDGRVAALGAARGEFRDGERADVAVPFNLLPARRPLRVISMSPPDGAQDVEGPVASVSLDLAGDVEEGAVTRHLRILLESFGVDPLVPPFAVSHVDTSLGRVTTIRTQECDLPAGAYTVVLDTEVCTTARQCLDQDLALDGAQPFRGQFRVAGHPEMPPCAEIEVALSSCPEDCPEGSYCSGGACVPVTFGPEGGGGVPLCDPEGCRAPEHVCDDETCVYDCRFFGLCLDPTMVCDESTGLCR